MQKMQYIPEIHTYINIFLLQLHAVWNWKINIEMLKNLYSIAFKLFVVNQIILGYINCNTLNINKIREKMSKKSN